MDARGELREFLASRRGKITPEQAGIESYGVRARRVPGLRREEVARLAGLKRRFASPADRCGTAAPRAPLKDGYW